MPTQVFRLKAEVFGTSHSDLQPIYLAVTLDSRLTSALDKLLRIGYVAGTADD